MTEAPRSKTSGISLALFEQKHSKSADPVTVFTFLLNNGSVLDAVLVFKEGKIFCSSAIVDVEMKFDIFDRNMTMPGLRGISTSLEGGVLLNNGYSAFSRLNGRSIIWLTFQELIGVEIYMRMADCERTRYASRSSFYIECDGIT